MKARRGLGNSPVFLSRALLSRGNVIMTIHNGTNGANILKFKGFQYDGDTVNGRWGADILVFDDVFYATGLGAGGNDVLMSANGLGNTLKGQAGNDIYYVTNDVGTVIRDGNGASAVVMKDVYKANVTLGDNDDLVNLNEVAGSIFKLGVGFDEVISANSGGGNKFVFGEDGRAILKYNSGMEFLPSLKADVIDVAGGRVEILFQNNMWNNSGQVSYDIRGFDSNEDVVRFDWGSTPDIITIDGDSATATWLSDNEVFQASFNGIAGSVPNGIFSGNTMPGIGAGFGQPQTTFFTLPSGNPDGYGLIG